MATSTATSLPWHRRLGLDALRHPRWAVAVAVTGLALAAHALFTEVTPGRFWGTTYGIAATVLMVVAALYGARRRMMRLASRRLGPARLWLAVHVYGGLLFLLLVFAHNGGQLPRAPIGWLLWGLAIWTVASGLVGLALQRWIPRMLASSLEVEALYERIPELVDELRGRAEEQIEQAGEPVRTFYTRELARTFAAPHKRFLHAFDPGGGKRSAAFAHLRGFLNDDDRERLATLERLLATKRALDAHYTLQWLLRAWLVLHVPTSLALLALVVVHIASVLYY